MSGEKIKWDAVIERAIQIVESYDTGVTLRQLFYRLVSVGLIPNTIPAYKRLSHLTAIERRAGQFPDLIDNTRRIRGGGGADDPETYLEELIAAYRRNRTEGQKYTICIGVEKNALVTQLQHWYRDKGIPVLAFGGYPSQTFVDEIKEYVESFDRPALMIYAGDFDATGVDIIRDFKNRTEGLWQHVEQIALNKKQIAEYQLPPLPGKSWDPRAARFKALHGELVQVELDALDPNVLKSIYDKAVDKVWDKKAFDKALKQEKEDRASMVTPSQAADIKKERDGFKESAEEAGAELLKAERREKALKSKLDKCDESKRALAKKAKEVDAKLAAEIENHKNHVDQLVDQHKDVVEDLRAEIADLKKEIG